MNDVAITIDGQRGSFPVEGGPVRMGDDTRMNVLFYKKAVLDPIKSRELGRPWTKAMDYVRIQQPGEKDCVDRPLRENDDAIYRWPRQWDQYRKQQVQAPSGTPVDVLFPQNQEIAANLHSLGCHTIEQLAGMTEHGAQTIGMGSTMWRNKAKEFLAAANGGAGMHRLQKQIDDERNKNEVLSSQLAMVTKQLELLSAQVNQKIIPGSIAPAFQPTLAQNAMRFSNDGPDEDEGHTGDGGEQEFEPQPLTGSQPLFVEETDEQAQVQEVQPKRRGRPPRSSI
jgi:hypothetical protein